MYYRWPKLFPTETTAVQPALRLPDLGVSKVTERKTGISCWIVSWQDCQSLSFFASEADCIGGVAAEAATCLWRVYLAMTERCPKRQENQDSDVLRHDFAAKDRRPWCFSWYTANGFKTLSCRQDMCCAYEGPVLNDVSPNVSNIKCLLLEWHEGAPMNIYWLVFPVLIWQIAIQWVADSHPDHPDYLY